MPIEDVEPNKPRFALVFYLFLASLLLILIGAAVVVTWRSHGVQKPPFNKHPTALLSEPLPWAASLSQSA